jgi:hypothetical protein
MKEAQRGPSATNTSDRRRYRGQRALLHEDTRVPTQQKQGPTTHDAAWTCQTRLEAPGRAQIAVHRDPVVHRIDVRAPQSAARGQGVTRGSRHAKNACRIEMLLQGRMPPTRERQSSAVRVSHAVLSDAADVDVPPAHDWSPPMRTYDEVETQAAVRLPRRTGELHPRAWQTREDSDEFAHDNDRAASLTALHGIGISFDVRSNASQLPQVPQRRGLTI